jgi:hypothetical protein
MPELAFIPNPHSEMWSPTSPTQEIFDYSSTTRGYSAVLAGSLNLMEGAGEADPLGLG